MDKPIKHYKIVTTETETTFHGERIVVEKNPIFPLAFKTTDNKLYRFNPAHVILIIAEDL